MKKLKLNKLSKSDFGFIMSEVFLNCVDSRDLINKRNKKWFDNMTAGVEFVLYNYFGVEVED